MEGTRVVAFRLLGNIAALIFHSVKMIQPIEMGQAAILDWQYIAHGVCARLIVADGDYLGLCHQQERQQQPR